MQLEIGFLLSAFIAGLITFFAPCTLPLVPGFLAFISGVPLDELKDQSANTKAQKTILYNGIFYVIGFTTIFILFGILFGFFGALLNPYRIAVTRIGGLFIIVFGLFLLGVNFPGASYFEKTIGGFGLSHLKPGKPTSSFAFGALFAAGWTPCIGPILASILLLASQSGSIGKGAFLLFIFSIGLAIPFVFLTLFASSATRYVKQLTKYLPLISRVGGVFLLFIGVLMLLDQFGVFNEFLYRTFDFLEYDGLLQYL